MTMRRMTKKGRCVTGVDHVSNRQAFRRFISQTIHTCDTLSPFVKGGTDMFDTCGGILLQKTPSP